MCDRWLQRRTYCYAKVIHETCNIKSTADVITILKSILHKVTISQDLDQSCSLG